MNRSLLLRQIRAAAHARGRTWSLVRQGATHEIWMCGVTRIVIPRHIDINDLTALRIRQTLQDELGQGWWR